MIISAREFRENQTKVLNAALEGQLIVLTSRIGNFKITPISKEDSLTASICNGLKEIKLIESGVIPAKSAKAFLNEL